MQTLLSAVLPVRGGKTAHFEVLIIPVFILGVLIVGYLIFEHIREWRTRTLWQRRNEAARRAQSED
jgi:hypothetical protein